MSTKGESGFCVLVGEKERDLYMTIARHGRAL